MTIALNWWEKSGSISDIISPWNCQPMMKMKKMIMISLGDVTLMFLPIRNKFSMQVFFNDVFVF